MTKQTREALKQAIATLVAIKPNLSKYHVGGADFTIKQCLDALIACEGDDDGN